MLQLGGSVHAWGLTSSSFHYLYYNYRGRVMNIDTAFFYSYTASCENRIRKSLQVPPSPFKSVQLPTWAENDAGTVRERFGFYSCMLRSNLGIASALILPGSGSSLSTTRIAVKQQPSMGRSCPDAISKQFRRAPEQPSKNLRSTYWAINSKSPPSRRKEDKIRIWRWLVSLFKGV